MATQELDPIFVKALKLLRSRSKDSTDQLKKMLDDVLAQRRPEGKREGEDEPKSFSKLGTKKDDSKRREAEKRNLEKLRKDLSDLSGEVPAKKPKLDIAEKDRDQNRDSKERKDKTREVEYKEEKPWEKERERKDHEKKEKKKIIIFSSTDSESESSEEEKDKKAEGLDADQFALDLGDLACVVCKQMDVTSGNNLVECQECHSLYHQECHRPPVTENVNDPRFVWYCSRCSKNMKKLVSKSSKPKPTPSLPVKEAMISKPLKPEPPSSLQPFKRLETSKPATTKESTSSSSSRPYSGLTGLASLAANLSTKESSKTVKESSLFAAALTGKTDVLVKSSSSKSSSSSSSSKSSLGLKGDFPKSASTSNLKLAMTKSASTSNLQKNSSSSSKTSQPSLLSADKRLQLMKKKAAAKMQDKRK